MKNLSSKFQRNSFVVAALMMLWVLFASPVFADTVNQCIASPYIFNYYTNANTTGVPDGKMTIVNPSGSNLCANIYVFDKNQQMEECCGCQVNANAQKIFSVNTNLTNNPLTSIRPNGGVIKIVSSVPSPGCDPTAAIASAGLVALITHPYSFSVNQAQSLFLSGSPSAGQPAQELSFLNQACAFVRYLGSGKGVCTCP